jgi:hypothetical protein
MHEHDVSGLRCGLRSCGTGEKGTCRSRSHQPAEGAAIHPIGVPKFIRVVHRFSFSCNVVLAVFGTRAAAV